VFAELNHSFYLYFNEYYSERIRIVSDLLLHVLPKNLALVFHLTIIRYYFAIGYICSTEYY